MKNIITTKLAAVVIVFGVGHAAAASEAGKKYVYKGDESARAICMSIAKNQPNRLKRVLDSNKISRFDNKVHTRFSCNDEDLLSFAESMGAQQVTRYLSPKFDGKENKMEVVSIEG